MNDEVLKELWEIKDQISREAAYDTAALLSRLQNAQKSSLRTLVNFSRDHLDTSLPMGTSTESSGERT
jgi:hypothetical protein